MPKLLKCVCGLLLLQSWAYAKSVDFCEVRVNGSTFMTREFAVEGSTMEGLNQYLKQVGLKQELATKDGTYLIEVNRQATYGEELLMHHQRSGVIIFSLNGERLQSFSFPFGGYSRFDFTISDLKLHINCDTKQTSN